MRLIRPVVAGVAILSAVLSAQGVPEFEVASIRPSAPQVQQASIGVHITGSQVRISYLSLRDYVAMAYSLPTGQVAGPDWLNEGRFDIAAKIPDGVPASDVARMLQKLLADRFELKVHHESKDLPVFLLAIARGGPKLVESAANANDPVAPGIVNVGGTGSAAGVGIDLGGGSSFTLANNQLEIKRATAATIVRVLTRLSDRPVLDTTRLTGTYDLTLDLIPEDYSGLLIRSAINAGVVLPPQALRALDLASADPFSNALQKFGLTLESRKSPLDVVVVDSMRKTPTDN